MIEFETARLVAKSNMNLVDFVLVEEFVDNKNPIDLLNIEKTTGKESGFVFYDKTNEGIDVCHIGFKKARNKFEITYGTKEEYRNQGYMSEALSALITWLFEYTKTESVWAIPNGNISEKILIENAFKQEKDDKYNWFVRRR